MTSHSQLPNPSSWDILLSRDDSEEDDLDSGSDHSDTTHIVPTASSEEREITVRQSTEDAPDLELQEKVKEILSNMSKIGLSLAEFLDALSWGDSDCISDSQIRTAQTSLMNSPRLPGILCRWWKAPRSSASHKSRPVAARPAMEEFARTCLRETIEDELETVAELFKSPDDASEAFFTQMSFLKLSDELQATAPTLWSLLRGSAYTEKQEKRNTHKNPSKVCILLTNHI